MPLRTRILLAMLLLALVPLVLFGLTAYIASTNSLINVERNNLESNLDGVNRALAEVQTSLAQTARDYSNWDDMHAQAAQEAFDQAWLEENIIPETTTSPIETFNLSVLGLWNHNNGLAYGYGPAQAIADLLPGGVPGARAGTEPVTRLLPLDKDVYIVVTSAIQTSDSKDANGVLLLGRKLGATDVEAIKSLTGFDVALYRGTNLIAATQNDNRAHSLSLLIRAEWGDTSFDQTNGNDALAYQPLKDETGNTVMTIVIRRPRNALIAAQNGIEGTLIASFLAASIMATLVALILGRGIVRPLLAMSERADKIAGGDYSQRVIASLTTHDELQRLADAFNKMTDRLVRNIEDMDRRAKEIADKNEALSIANAKAHEAIRIKSEFLATMSHELRTPLNAILGFSDMLTMGIYGTLNEKQQEKVAGVHDCGQRLLTLINDVLDLSRIEAGRLELNIQPFSPRQLAERIAAQMSVLATQGNIGFNVNIDAALPLTVLGDEKRTEQIMVNLLSNAVKFTEKGAVTLDVFPEGAQWIIRVTDTGIGIPAHALDLIFEEFRQIDSGSRRAYRGTGLGLAITRNLIQAMGGKITVESTLEVGSKFVVTLPMAVPTIAQVVNAQIS